MLNTPGEETGHLTSPYDDLLEPTRHGSEDGRSVTDLLLAPGNRDESPRLMARRRSLSASAQRRAFFIRGLALLCACCLSIGSHYGTYVLGPLKSRLSRELGTSHTEFGLLISAFSLNSTWTPLVGGVMASRLGTTFTSILATGAILVGQMLLLTGDIWGNVRIMALGMFVFGLGVSPLAVVQETIIVRFFKSHGLGVSMAFGLIAGKGASFISARTSYTLTERFGTRASFYVATFLAGMSVVVNIVYILVSKWLVDGAGAELEASDIQNEARRRSVHSLSEAQALEDVAEKRKVKLREISKLGDIFWAYVGINALGGTIWTPFTHLAANIIEKRYDMTEEGATNQASYLLAGSLILYPICGYLVDRLKHRPIIVQLLMISSGLTIFCYLWLALPPQLTQTSLPSVVAFGAGYGFAPLLLVVLVPQIVPHKYVSTALGVHKSLEQTGSTIFQTLAGLSLDKKSVIPKSPEIPARKGSSIQSLLNVFLFLNILHFLSIVVLAYLQRRKESATMALKRRVSFVRSLDDPDVGPIKRSTVQDGQLDKPTLGAPLPSGSSRDEERPLLERTCPPRDDLQSKREVTRGEVFVGLCGGLIIFAWVLFMGTAWFKLGFREGRV